MRILFKNVSDTFNKYTEAIIGFLVVGIIGIIIIPMPSLLLDFLLVSNITIGIIILLLTLSTKNVLEFSTFPTLLLITTLFRLALNISSTRLILGEGDAGNVINAFGNFVTGNNYIVGAVIFIIIVIVQLVVITNGSSRVSEVTARFTLDAMPGKQMAIDADLNTGLIDEQTAKQRRLNLQREADFYGAMDGASKFVKGDAIAGIIITVINLVGGILIFTLQHGLSAMEAIDRFGKLTIGDGLVSQIPALLISISAGILVTRSEDGNTFGKSLTEQIFSTPDVMMIASVVLLVISLVPAFPTIPFLVIALLIGSTGYLLKQNEKEELLVATETENLSVASQKEAEKDDFKVSQIEPIALEIGYGLIPLVDESREENLVNQITAIRRQCSNELGIIVNSIRIRDNLQLAPNDYVIKIKGNIVARGTIYLNKYMVLDPGNGEFNIEGIPTKEPAFGIDAIWIDENQKDKAELEGYTIVEPSTILVTHLKEVIKSHSYELLGRQEVKQLLDFIKEKYEVVVDELIPDIMTLGEVQKVLQGLLKENVPITDLVTILETLADNAPMIKDTEMLVEQVRQALKRTITKNYLNAEGKLPVITIHPSIEETISENTQKTMSGSIPILKPEIINKIFDNLNKAVEQSQIKGIDPVILTSPKIRIAFRNLISYNFPNLPVISITEIPNEVDIEAVGMVERI